LSSEKVINDSQQNTQGAVRSKVGNIEVLLHFGPSGKRPIGEWIVRNIAQKYMKVNTKYLGGNMATKIAYYWMG
jgi:hypothetical protein